MPDGLSSARGTSCSPDPPRLLLTPSPPGWICFSPAEWPVGLGHPSSAGFRGRAPRPLWLLVVLCFGHQVRKHRQDRNSPSELLAPQGRAHNATGAAVLVPSFCDPPTGYPLFIPASARAELSAPQGCVIQGGAWEPGMPEALQKGCARVQCLGDGLGLFLLCLQVEPAVGGGQEVCCLLEAPQGLNNHHCLLNAKSQASWLGSVLTTTLSPGYDYRLENRLRDIKCFVQGHTAWRWLCGAANPDLLDS